jgi:hypothetical protein
MADALITRRSSVKNEYVLLADVEVTSASTNVTISGLNIGKNEEILLVATDINVGSNRALRLNINGNNTASNYWHQKIQASGTTVSSARTNNGEFSLSIGGFNTATMCNIKLTESGFFVFQSNMNSDYQPTSTVNVGLMSHYGTSTFTSTSITSIRINASASNSIGVGSRFQLYRIAE